LNFRVRVIEPTDGNFNDTVAELSGKVEHFDIKSETVKSLKFEESVRYIPAKKFEPALGIPNSRRRQNLHYQVEKPTEHLDAKVGGQLTPIAANRDWR